MRPAAALFTLGLVIGLLVGLSASPVTGTVVAGIFSIASALAAAAAAASKEGPNNWLLAARPEGWITAICFGLIVGLGAGMAARVSDALGFLRPSLREDLERSGFSSSQIDRIMARLADTWTPSIQKKEETKQIAATLDRTAVLGGSDSRSAGAAGAVAQFIATHRDRDRDEDLLRQLHDAFPELRQITDKLKIRGDGTALSPSELVDVLVGI